MNFKEKFKRVLLEPPHCILGKKGINGNKGFITHVQNLLKRYKIIKIKLSKNSLFNTSLEEMVNKIVKETNSYLLDNRGRILIISTMPFDKKKNNNDK